MCLKQCSEWALVSQDSHGTVIGGPRMGSSVHEVMVSITVVVGPITVVVGPMLVVVVVVTCMCVLEGDRVGVTVVHSVIQ